jgi:hypothetical protein
MRPPGAVAPENPAALAEEGRVRRIATMVDAEAALAELNGGRLASVWKGWKEEIRHLIDKELGQPLSPGDTFTKADVVAIALFQQALGLRMTGRIDRPLRGAVSQLTRVDLPDPGMEIDESEEERQRVDEDVKSGVISQKRVFGTLFVNGVSPDDVAQGGIGNCYFLAALATIAAQCPATIQDMIKDNGDGTYTVRFFRKDERTRPATYAATHERVDADFHTRGGRELYAKARDAEVGKGRELWVMVVEKAYVQFAAKYGQEGNEDTGATGPGEYGVVNGGFSGWVMEVVTGKPAEFHDIPETPDRVEEVYTLLRDSLGARSAVGASISEPGDLQLPQMPAFLAGKIPPLPAPPDEKEPEFEARVGDYAKRFEPIFQAISQVSMEGLSRGERNEFEIFADAVQVFVDDQVAWYVDEMTNRVLPARERGVVTGHEYSVHEVFRVGPIPYVKLRNPHARNEPRGGGANDGYFVLPLEEFMRYSDGISVGASH